MNKEQLLYRYFSNSLSSEQEKQLQDLLDTDMEFKEQFDFEQDLKRVVREGEKAKLKSKLQGFENDISQETPVIQLNDSRKKSNFNWSLAASVAILFGLGWFGYTTFTGTDYEDLYQENFQEYPNTVYPITRGNNEDNSLKRKAFVAYETDDNSRAIELFKDLMATDNSESTTFYLAQSYLKNGQPEEAIKLFDKVILDKGEFAPQALWYAALAYLNSDQKQNAVQALDDLITDGRYKKDKASILLEKLE